MEPQKSNGALIGLIIVVVILVLGGIYIWQKHAQEKAASMNDTTTGDDAAEMEANLNSIDLDTIDNGI